MVTGDHKSHNYTILNVVGRWTNQLLLPVFKLTQATSYTKCESLARLEQKWNSESKIGGQSST